MPEARGPALFARIRSRWGGGSREALEAEDEQAVARRRGTVPIAQVRERQRARVSGAVHSITYFPTSGPARVGATLYDGTGTIEILWHGRRDIPGIFVGRHLEVEGTVARRRDHLAFLDPLYRILPAEDS